MEKAMTVEEAREKGLCRVCGEVMYFRPITYDFGREFAHTDCLKEIEKAKTVFEVKVISISQEIMHDDVAATEDEAIERLRVLLGPVKWNRIEVTALKMKDGVEVRRSQHPKKYKIGKDRTDVLKED